MFSCSPIINARYIVFFAYVRQIKHRLKRGFTLAFVAWYKKWNSKKNKHTATRSQNANANCFPCVGGVKFSGGTNGDEMWSIAPASQQQHHRHAAPDGAGARAFNFNIMSRECNSRSFCTVGANSSLIISFHTHCAVTAAFAYRTNRHMLERWGEVLRTYHQATRAALQLNCAFLCMYVAPPPDVSLVFHVPWSLRIENPSFWGMGSEAAVNLLRAILLLVAFV